MMRVQPGEHRGQRGTADCSGNVTAHIGKPFVGEPVDVWGFGVGVSGKAVIGPSVIVADDQYDVRTGWRGPIGTHEPLPHDQPEKGEKEDRPKPNLGNEHFHYAIQ